MIRAYKVDAVILSRRTLGEADRLITLFTREFGKKTVIAKGIRRTRSRRAAHLELFSHSQILLYPTKHFDIVTEAMSLNSFLFLRKKLERVAFVYIALELTERLTAEFQEADAIYDELLQFLQLLNHQATNREKAKQALIAYKQFLLEELGFIETHLQVSETHLDERIEHVLERRLKSPLLLTSIQNNL